MSQKSEILPAVMPKTFDDLERQVECVLPFTTAIQIDVMDGVFVGKRSWPFTTGEVPEVLPNAEEIFYEVHLMIDNPYDIGAAFISVGAKRIIAHIEVFDDVAAARACLCSWRALGAEVGISLLLDTPLERITPLLDEKIVDMVQVMSIAQIGVQGNPFDERAYSRLEELRLAYPWLMLAVDGGVSETNIRALKEAGASHFGVGSAILNARDPQAAYEHLCDSIKE